MSNGADDGMMATDAPRAAPNPVKNLKPKKKKAKTTGAEGGGATGVPLPPSAALDTRALCDRHLGAYPSPDIANGQERQRTEPNLGRLPTSTASAARRTTRMSAGRTTRFGPWRPLQEEELEPESQWEYGTSLNRPLSCRRLVASFNKNHSGP